jgi:hypothetical protein
MALRLKPEIREEWRKYIEGRIEEVAPVWRPVPRAEPAPEPEPSPNTFDIYSKTWVDT